MLGEWVTCRLKSSGLSLREAARRAHIHPSHLSRIASGQRHPTPEVARALDDALEARGELVALAADQRPVADPAVQESEALRRLLAEQDPDATAALAEHTGHLAVAYLAQPAAAMLNQAADARRTALTALRTRRVRPAEVVDTVRHAGYLSGILAYAALDLGHPTTALTHAAAAWDAAEVADDNQLRAWVRGTQSLILRFAGRYPEALAHALDGLEHADSGTARVRLLCGVAQCHANLSDPGAARRALADAETARDQVHGIDPYAGLFGFSPAKQAYYSGSVLIWLPDRADAERAWTEAGRAIDMWSQSTPDDRSLDDEALAGIYAATAAVHLRDLDRAEAALAPILDLPPERRISWIGKRLARVSDLLGQPPYLSDRQADNLLDRIREYA